MKFSRDETVEWFVEDKSLLAQFRASPPAPLAKKNSAGILFQFQQLWGQGGCGFRLRCCAANAQTLAASTLLCLGRHAVTGLLTNCLCRFSLEVQIEK